MHSMGTLEELMRQPEPDGEPLIEIDARPKRQERRQGPRDPRFDGLSGDFHDERYERDYGFLEAAGRQEAEMLRQKERTRAEDELLRQLEERGRRADARRLERDVKERVYELERERVRRGKRPYVPKAGEMKKLVTLARAARMSGPEMERAVRNRRKRGRRELHDVTARRH